MQVPFSLVDHQDRGNIRFIRKYERNHCEEREKTIASPADWRPVISAV